MKPFSLDARKVTKPVLTDVDLAQWKEVIMANVKSEEDWVPLIGLEWKNYKAVNRGLLVGDDLPGQARKLQKMITFIATYAPSSLFKEITQRSTSLAAIWEVVRKWAGVRASSSKHLTYARLRLSFDPAGNQTYQELYYNLRDAKENCLISATSAIKFDGKALTEDEELTPCIEADIIVDWLQAIGGQPLLELVFRVYAKELEAASLADLQERISDNLPSLITEAESGTEGQAAAAINKMNIRGQTRGPPRREQFSKGRSDQRPRSDNRERTGQNRDRTGLAKSCALCKAKGLKQFNTHSIAQCFGLTSDDRKSIAKIHKVFAQDDTDGESDFKEEFQDEEGSSDQSLEDQEYRCKRYNSRCFRLNQ